MKKNVFLSVAAASAIAAIATGLALPAFSEPIPEDSASMFRKQQGKAPLPPTSGTTGFYTPPNQKIDPPSPYQPWTLSFQGQEKCMFVAWMGSNNDMTLCARITTDGTGNAELYQPANKLGEVDFRPNGWFESTYPQYARQWPNWPVAPATETVALKTITFYNQGPVESCTGGRSSTCTTVPGASISIEPILGPSGLASDWRFNYLGQKCLIAQGRYWVLGCTLP